MLFCRWTCFLKINSHKDDFIKSNSVATTTTVTRPLYCACAFQLFWISRSKTSSSFLLLMWSTVYNRWRRLYRLPRPWLAFFTLWASFQLRNSSGHTSGQPFILMSPANCPVFAKILTSLTSTAFLLWKLRLNFYFRIFSHNSSKHTPFSTRFLAFFVLIFSLLAKLYWNTHVAILFLLWKLRIEACIRLFF